MDGAPTFNSSDYLNIFITTLAEVPGLILAELTVERLGRWAAPSPQQRAALSPLVCGAQCRRYYNNAMSDTTTRRVDLHLPIGR